MKNFSFLFMALVPVAFSGCNSGNVQVNDGSAPASQPGTVPHSSVQPNSNPSGTPSATPSTAPTSTTNNPAAKIFFERIRTQGGLPNQILSISFLAQEAGGMTPFGVSMKGFQPFSSTPIYSVSPVSSDDIPESVEYVQSIDIGTFALLSTTLSNMETTQLFGFPQEVAAFSFNRRSSQLAWISTSDNGSESANAYVSNLHSGSSHKLDTSKLLPAIGPVHTEWSGDGSALGILASDKSLWLYSSKNSFASPALISKSATAVVFSPDNKKMAYLNSTDSSFHSVDVASLRDSVMGKVQSTQVHDLIWPIDPQSTGITYWSRLSSGQQEIRSFASGIETALAELSLPVGTDDGVVCPTWVGDTLYFGNNYAGTYAIEKVTPGTGPAAKTEAIPSVFAQAEAQDLEEGFVCPQVAQ